MSERDPGERDARVRRQDAQGVDVPAGRDAEEVTPEQMTPDVPRDDRRGEGSADREGTADRGRR